MTIWSENFELAYLWTLLVKYDVLYVLQLHKNSSCLWLFITGSVVDRPLLFCT